MTQKYPSIDYTDMISDLKEDISSEFITEDSMLYVVRQKEEVYVEAKGENVFPVIDYFYDRPALKEDIVTMKVADAKKLCFEILEQLTDTEDDSFAAAVKLLTEDLKSYTAGNPKRNSRSCKVLFEDNSGIPMMIYYDDTGAADKLASISAGELLKELKDCM
jgi:hypothetical protein